MSEATDFVEALFPGISSRDYQITSDKDDDYNCIAWAADEDKDNWWWPELDGYWPPGISRQVTLQSFIEAFSTLKYFPCDSMKLECGFDKVAIYTDVDGKPTHGARQLRDGTWTSKLGSGWDIGHADYSTLHGQTYGQAVQALRRPIPGDPWANPFLAKIGFLCPYVKKLWRWIRRK